MPREYKDAAKFLREARKAADKTQKKVAEELDCSVAFVSQWETGERRPPLEKLAAIARAYEAEEDKLKECLQGSMEAKREAEDGFGVAPIEVVLKAVAADAKRTGTRAIVHSYSCEGFMTGENPTLATVVLECAAAGVDVVYIAFPPASTRGSTPVEVRKKLQDRFQEADDDLWSNGQKRVMGEARKHLWFVASTGDQPGVAGAVFSAVVRLLAVIQETKGAGDTDESAADASAGKPKRGTRSAVARHAAANERDDSADLERVMPERFTLHSVWLNIDMTTDNGDARQKWERSSRASGSATRYRNALKHLKESGEFTIQPLFT